MRRMRERSALIRNARDFRKQRNKRKRKARTCGRVIIIRVMAGVY